MTDWQEAYDLADLENSNLRKCLAFAGRHLSGEQRAQLRAMIERPIDCGGVVKDAADDQFEENQEIKRLCVKAAGLLREAIETDDPAALLNSNWSSRADDLASKLMEFDPPTPEASLAEIRNLDQALAAETKA